MGWADWQPYKPSLSPLFGMGWVSPGHMGIDSDLRPNLVGQDEAQHHFFF